MAHEDNRRRLFTIFNGDLGNFQAVQLKWFEFQSDSLVGEHYHPACDEIFCIIRGGGVYELVNVDHPEQREKFDMKEGDIVLVPKMVAHRALVEKGSIIIGANSQIYVSPEKNDLPFDFNASLATDK